MRFQFLVCLCVCLAGCDQPNNSHSEKTSSAPTDAAAANLLRDVSGVWGASQGGLITIDYRDNELRLVIGDDPKFVKLGDIDSDQQTINLLLKRASDNADVIWTLHRVWDQDKASFHLVLILDDGSQDELSFVRKVTADDINRLANLYARTNIPANVVDSGNQLASPTGATAPAPDLPAPAPDSPAPAISNDDNTLIGGTNGGASYTQAQFDHWLTINSQFHTGHDATRDETQFLFYDHNGSIAKATILYPAEQSVQIWTIVYEVPRPGISDAGARQGDVIFSGRADANTGSLSGTSYIFNKNCGKSPFEVHESNQGPGTDGNLTVLVGNAPVVNDQTCQIVRYKELGLDFEELYKGIVVEKKQ